MTAKKEKQYIPSRMAALRGVRWHQRETLPGPMEQNPTTPTKKDSEKVASGEQNSRQHKTSKFTPRHLIREATRELEDSASQTNDLSGQLVDEKTEKATQVREHSGGLYHGSAVNTNRYTHAAKQLEESDVTPTPSTEW